eukprot:767605-Hanusia_phi.AAC.1
MESLNKVQAREKAFMLKVWKTISDMAARDGSSIAPAPAPAAAAPPPPLQQSPDPEEAASAVEATPLRAITNLQDEHNKSQELGRARGALRSSLGSHCSEAHQKDEQEVNVKLDKLVTSPRSPAGEVAGPPRPPCCSGACASWTSLLRSGSAGASSLTGVTCDDGCLRGNEERIHLDVSRPLVLLAAAASDLLCYSRLSSPSALAPFYLALALSTPSPSPLLSLTSGSCPTASRPSLAPCAASTFSPCYPSARALSTSSSTSAPSPPSLLKQTAPFAYPPSSSPPCPCCSRSFHTTGSSCTHSFSLLLAACNGTCRPRQTCQLSADSAPPLVDDVDVVTAFVFGASRREDASWWERGEGKLSRSKQTRRTVNVIELGVVNVKCQ